MNAARFHELDGRSAYQVLGVLEAAGPDEINKAYRRRMRELHPDRGGDRDRDEAQHVSVAHRWLIRHRGDYERFVFERRKDDPQWGRVREPLADAEFDFPTGPVTGASRVLRTGSLRVVGPERSAEWAERQQRGSWREGPPTGSWSRTGAESRTGWGNGGGEAGAGWVAGPPTQEQLLLDASRQEVARRREARLRADEERRRKQAATQPSTQPSPPAAERPPSEEPTDVPHSPTQPSRVFTRPSSPTRSPGGAGASGFPG